MQEIRDNEPAAAVRLDIKEKIQRLGGFMAGMVMPNIGAFIAWGLITALFIPSGWIPNERLAVLVEPMIIYLLPLLLGYTGGLLVHDRRGGIVGATATIGIIVGAGIPMFIGAMIMGPLAGYLIKLADNWVEDKIPLGFEMLVNNFSAGLLGMGLAIAGFLIIGPLAEGLSGVLGAAIEFLLDKGMLPFVALLIEPAKVLFLNNAVNHGLLAPLGVISVAETGRAIHFLLESNPGPGLGLLLAIWMFGQGTAKKTASGAIVIHFFGGIHEIYFPYILAQPVLIAGVLAGGLAANFWFVITGAGLVATPSPGSIFAYLAMTPRGAHAGVFGGVFLGALISFLVCSVLLKVFPSRTD